VRILLTEDDDSLRAFVGRALEIDGHVVDPACDGMAAMEALDAADGAFDLLFSDVRMPLMDGIRLARSTAERWPHLPVLLMTGYADQSGGHAEALPQTIGGILTKPFSLEDMRAAIDRAYDAGGQADLVRDEAPDIEAMAHETVPVSVMRQVLAAAYSVFSRRSR